MKTNNETVSDIIREMREGVLATKWNEQTFQEFSDRIEAAHRREVENLRKCLIDLIGIYKHGADHAEEQAVLCKAITVSLG